jgi:hypothetical protein
VNVICEVTVIVTGAAPQRNTIVPPPAAACCSAAAVQLPGVPSPTIAVGADTSYSAGRSQSAAGTAPSPGPAASPALPDGPPHAAIARGASQPRARFTPAASHAARPGSMWVRAAGLRVGAGIPGPPIRLSAA